MQARADALAGGHRTESAHSGSGHINFLIFRILLGIVVLAPLPLGSNRPLAWSALAFAIALLMVGWGSAVVTGRARAPVPLGWLGGIATCFALALGWGWVQSMGTVPQSIWHPLWAEASLALGGPVAGGISIDPALSHAALLRLLTYGGVFWLAAQLCRERSRAREALVAVAAAGVLYAAYGLLVHFAGWERILWLEKWAYIGDLTSSFVNRNAYGAYAGIGLVCCTALFLHELRPPRRGETRRVYDMTEILLLRAMPFMIGGVLLGSALLLSHSRGAFLSTGAGILTLMAAVVASRLVRPRTALLVGLVIALAGTAVLGMSGEGTFSRLADMDVQVGDRDRAELYRIALQAIKDAPLTGHGIGAFAAAFRMYRETTLSAPTVWDYAHNVHLEMAMDLGLPAAVLLYIAFLTILGICLRGLLRRRRDQIYPATALAVAVLLGLHGLVDFSAQMPAIAVTLAFLLGLGFAQSWRTSDGNSE